MIVVKAVEGHGQVVLVLQKSSSGQQQQSLTNLGWVGISLWSLVIEIGHHQRKVVQKVQLRECQTKSVEGMSRDSLDHRQGLASGLSLATFTGKEVLTKLVQAVTDRGVEKAVIATQIRDRDGSRTRNETAKGEG